MCCLPRMKCVTTTEVRRYMLRGVREVESGDTGPEFELQEKIFKGMILQIFIPPREPTVANLFAGLPFDSCRLYLF